AEQLEVAHGVRLAFECQVAAVELEFLQGLLGIAVGLDDGADVPWNGEVDLGHGGLVIHRELHDRGPAPERLLITTARGHHALRASELGRAEIDAQPSVARRAGSRLYRGEN